MTAFSLEARRPATEGMRQVLVNLADGLPGDHHLNTPQLRKRGGYFMQYWSLRARGWISEDDQITAAGLQVIGRAVPGSAAIGISAEASC